MIKHLIEYVATGLCLFPVVTFGYVFFRQYQCRPSNHSVYPLQILNLRSAFLLPMFAIFITISVIFPGSFQALVPLEAALEAYSVVCFYAMIVFNCGGPLKVVNILNNSDRIACCDCQTRTPVECYKRVYRSVWQFVYIRPVIASIGAVIWYKTSYENVFLLIQGICFLQTVWMLLGLLSLAYTLYDDCYGLNIVYKLLVIKVSVGLVVIQGFVIDNLYSYGYISVPDSYNYSNFNKDQRLQRAYCLLCLVEFILLCIPLWWGFGYQIVPSKFYSLTSVSAHYAEKAGYGDYPVLLSESLIAEDDKNFLNHSSMSDSVSSTRSNSARARAEFCSMLYDCINIFRYPCDPLVNINTDDYKIPLLQMQSDDFDGVSSQAIVS